MSGRNYRAEARAARAAARDHLNALREARLARRGRAPAAPAGSATRPQPAPEADLAAVTVSRAAESMAALAAPPAPAEPEAVAGPAASVAPGAATADPPAASPPRRAAPAPQASPASDLAELPGVGPGLVWLLAEAGCPTRADLAAADPVALAERLGVAGRLIDVPGLQALAAGAG